MPTKDRIIRFHAALNASNRANYKADMLAGYGVESTKDLTNEQLDELIASLNADRKPVKEASREVRKLRHQTLNVLTDLGVMKHSKDWNSVNNYLKQPRILGKRLNQTEDVDELKSLHRKLRKILRERDAKVEQEIYLATNN